MGTSITRPLPQPNRPEDVVMVDSVLDDVGVELYQTPLFLRAFNGLKKSGKEAGIVDDMISNYRTQSFVIKLLFYVLPEIGFSRSLFARLRAHLITLLESDYEKVMETMKFQIGRYRLLYFDAPFEVAHEG